MGQLPPAHPTPFSQFPYFQEINHALYETAEQAMFVVDENERILHANAAACLLAGGSAEALQGAALADLLRQDGRFWDLNGRSHPITLVQKPLENGRVLLIVTTTLVSEGNHSSVAAELPPQADVLSNSPNTPDLTELLLARAALRQSQTNFWAIFNNSLQGFVLVDRERKVLAVNSVAADMVAKQGKPQFSAGQHVAELFFPAQPEGFAAAFAQALQGVSSSHYYQINVAEGQFWYEVHLNPAATDDGQITGVSLSFLDITDRKTAETALRESEERLRLFIDHAPAALAMFDREMCYLAASRRWLTDYAIDNVSGRSHYDMFPDIPDWWKALHRRGMAGEVITAEEDKFVRQDGRIHWLRWEVRPWYTAENIVGGIVVFSEDITERKRAQAAIEELQEVLAEAESVAKMGSFKWDLVTQKFTWSDGMFQVYQIEKSAFEGDIARVMKERLHPDDWAKANEAAAKTFKEQRPVSLAYRLVLPDGAEPVVWQDSRLIYDENGRPTAVIGYVQDITERKAAEQALRNSEEQYDTALENMLEGCQIISFDWRYLYLNASVVASSHRRKDEMLGRTMMEVFPGIDETEMFAVLRRCMAERTSAFFENKFVYDDGSYAWFDLSVQPVPDGLFILSVDITERKQVAEALRQSEARFFTAFQLSPAALSLTRQDGRLVDVNASYERLSGYTQAELIGHDATEFGIFTLAQRDDLRRRMVEQGGRLHEAEIEVRNKSGELRHVLYSVESVEIGDEAYALTLAFDITDRKQLEMALKEMADNMATAQAITHSGSWELRVAPDGSFSSSHIWSDECYRIFGLEPGFGPVSVDKFYSMVHPDDVTAVRQVFQEGIAERKETSWEYRVVWPDGSIRTIFDQVKPLVDERTGQLIKVVGLVQDITEGKRAEATIEQLNRRMEMILNSAGEGIYGADVDGRITFINPTMAHMLGWEPDDLLDKVAHTVFHHTRPDGTPFPAEECGVQLSVRNGQQFQNDEDTYWHRDGQPVLVDYTCTPIRDAGEILGSVMVVRDITERRKVANQQLLLKEQLRQAQKMESIGRLAGGVAHDFNNQLAVIKLYSDLIRYRMPKDDPLLPKLEQIRQAVDRASHLTRQLLAFSRKQVLQPMVLDMNELVMNLEKMLARLIGEDIMLSTDLQPGLWPVTADPGQLEQVIMNLVINARDAMTTGGMVTIETQNLILDETTLTVHQDALRGPVVTLAITDTGHGMDEDTRRQVFEPFFTTKEPGKGTGLGLATVHGIVKQSGGTIYVYSEPGQGTTFKVYLPASEGAVTELVDVGQTAVLQYGHETILLVEDEAVLRHLVRLTLEEIGYTILEAEDGNAALALADEHAGTIDLLLTDVVLPQKSGRKLAEELNAQCPEMKVLFMSGYMDDAIMRHGVLMAEMNFLSKPFSRSVLASKVREVLEKPTAR